MRNKDTEENLNSCDCPSEVALIRRSLKPLYESINLVSDPWSGLYSEAS